MKISYNWLKEYVDFNLTPQETADALTSIGLETEGCEEVERIPGGLKGIFVGEVLTCEPHPNSDHMHVCTVRTQPDAEPVQIVCGAPNVAAGQKVIVATVGAVLTPAGEEQSFTIKKSKLRGIESLGMICAEDEIGVGQSHDGIIVLPADAVVGTPAAEYYKLESDYVLDVDITPNRADACSHYGVARDLYAYLKQNNLPHSELHRPSVEEFSVDSHDLEIDVQVEATEACPRYCAVSLKGCEVKESPQWLKDHLNAIGLRPINNVVDVTNYIMMAYGQPLHCFDADMVRGQKVVVRTLPEGTPFQTLDGVEHKLSERDLCICNAEEPMCIAGVFGGRGSGTYETTRNILLESAYFHPTWIRKSARRHALQTDASFRFERGIDPDGQIYALKAAALLIKQLAGGTIAMEIRDVEQPGLVKAFDVTLPFQYVTDLVGKALPADEVRRIVESLEMRVVEATPEALRLSVPAYRVDVQRPCDVVEDVLRIYGYNNVEIPTTLHSSLTIKGDVDRSERLQQLLSEQLVGMGYREILNNSLTKTAYYAELEGPLNIEHAVKVLNPLSQDLGVLRGTMLFGGLETIAHNAHRQMPNLRLFELGNCYHYNAEKRNAEHPLAPYSEEPHLALWLTGRAATGSWTAQEEENTFFHLKGVVASLLTRLGIESGICVATTCETPLLSRALVITDRGGKTLCEMGLVRRPLLAAQEIEGDVYYADLHWNALMRYAKKYEAKWKEISKYPAVERDLALLLDEGIEFAQIENLAHRAEKKLLRSVSLFDVYEGKKLPAGKKSYAVRFLLQDESKTLGDKAIEAVMNKIINVLKQELGAELR